MRSKVSRCFSGTFSAVGAGAPAVSFNSPRSWSDSVAIKMSVRDFKQRIVYLRFSFSVGTSSTFAGSDLMTLERNS